MTRSNLQKLISIQEILKDFINDRDEEVYEEGRREMTLKVDPCAHGIQIKGLLYNIVVVDCQLYRITFAIYCLLNRLRILHL